MCKLLITTIILFLIPIFGQQSDEQKIRKWIFAMKYGKLPEKNTPLQQTKQNHTNNQKQQDSTLKKLQETLAKIKKDNWSFTGYNIQNRNLIEKARRKLQEFGVKAAPYLVEELKNTTGALEDYHPTVGAMDIVPHDIARPRPKLRASAILHSIINLHMYGVLYGSKKFTIDITPDLILLLDHPHKDVVHDVAMLLGDLRHKAKKATPKLLKILEKAPDIEMKYCLIWALGHTGDQNSNRVIAKYVKSENSTERFAALQGLSGGILVPEVGKVLLNHFMHAKNLGFNERKQLLIAMQSVPTGQFTDEVIDKIIFDFGAGPGGYTLREHYRAKLLLALLKEKSIPRLASVLADPHSQLNKNAIVAFLCKTGVQDPKIIADMVKVFEQGLSEYEYKNILHSIGELGPAAAPFIPVLIKIAIDPQFDEITHSYAMATVEKLATKTPKNVDVLWKIVNQEECMAKYHAIKILHNFAQSPPELNRHLLSMIYYPGHTGEYALELLAQNTNNKKLIPILIETIKNSHSESLYRTSVKLLKGKMAAAKIKAVIEKRSDKNARLQKRIAQLASFLQHKNVVLRRKAAYEFINLSKTSLPVPILIQALEDSDYQVRWYAAWALKNIGKQATDAIPSLVRALKDQHHLVRKDAAIALGEMGEKALPTIPNLVENLSYKSNSWNDSTAAMASLALAKLGPKAIPALANKNALIQGHAAWTLGEMGKKAHSALPTLQSMVNKDKWVVEMVKNAISKIEN